MVCTAKNFVEVFAFGFAAGFLTLMALAVIATRGGK
jgi:hypothetical protein